MHPRFIDWLEYQKYDYDIHPRYIQNPWYIKNVYIQRNRDAIFSHSDGEVINYLLTKSYTWKEISKKKR